MNLGVTCEMRSGLVIIRAEALRTGRAEARAREWCLAAARQAEVLQVAKVWCGHGIKEGHWAEGVQEQRRCWTLHFNVTPTCCSQTFAFTALSIFR